MQVELDPSQLESPTNERTSRGQNARRYVKQPEHEIRQDTKKLVRPANENGMNVRCPRLELLQFPATVKVLLLRSQKECTFGPMQCRADRLKRQERGPVECGPIAQSSRTTLRFPARM